MAERTFFTIGYEGASAGGFVTALRDAGVAVLIDVRDAPWSRRPEFCKMALSETLSAAGIRYVHLKGLGNPKPGRDAARAGDTERYREIFGAHLDGDTARRDLAAAAGLAAAAPACLMCYEADPAQCHRAIVADRLARATGMEFRHLRRAAPADPAQLGLALNEPPAASAVRPGGRT